MKFGTAFKERVRGLAWFAPERIQEAEENFRTHDEHQRAVLRGLLSEVGIADGLVAWIPDATVRESLRALPSRDPRAFAEWASTYDGPVRLIDGHARKNEIQQDTAVVITDLDDDEAATLLATFDAVSALADLDAKKLAAHLAHVDPMQSDANDLLEELREYANKENAPAKKVEAKEIDVSAIELKFFLSVRGPVGSQPDALDRLRAALQELPGCEVNVGIA